MKVVNGLAITLEEDKKLIMCLAAQLREQFSRVLLHEIIFFFLSVFSSSELLGKITTIRSKLPTAAC